MKWKPEIGEIFYSVDLIGDRKYVVYHWFDEDTESSEMLEAGIVFKTKKEAIAATELCLSALRGELVRREDVIKAIKKASKVNGCGYAPYDAGSRDCAHEIIKAVEEL